jgi:carbon monoxide dehydrogenase subunit G
MTEVFIADTTIDRPVDVVWARLIDWDSATRWMPGVDALRARKVQPRSARR